MKPIFLSDKYPGAVKLNIKGLYLQYNETDLIFTFEGARIGTVDNNFKFKKDKDVKVSRGIAREINDFIAGLMAGTIIITQSKWIGE